MFELISQKRTITAHDYDDFRDSLPSSGLFEMTDCSLEIWCPVQSEVEEVQRMVSLVESMVHVTDVRIGSDVENLTSDNYRVVIIEDNSHVGKKNFIR